MRILRNACTALLTAALLVAVQPASGNAEMEKAVIQILGGMQCSL